MSPVVSGYIYNADQLFNMIENLSFFSLKRICDNWMNPQRRVPYISQIL